MTGPDRRAALTGLVGIVGFLFGRSGPPSQYGRPIQLVLDDVAQIDVFYRGQRVSVHPQEVINALRAGRE